MKSGNAYRRRKVPCFESGRCFLSKHPSVSRILQQTNWTEMVIFLYFSCVLLFFYFFYFFYIQLILIAGKQAFKVSSISDNTLKKSFEGGHLWLSRKCVSTELNCRQISVVVHHSPDKLVVDSLVWIGRICLFADWVICVWQIVSNQRFLNVNKTLHCYTYTATHPRPSASL